MERPLKLNLTTTKLIASSVFNLTFASATAYVSARTLGSIHLLFTVGFMTLCGYFALAFVSSAIKTVKHVVAISQGAHFELYTMDGNFYSGTQVQRVYDSGIDRFILISTGIRIAVLVSNVTLVIVVTGNGGYEEMSVQSFIERYKLYG